MFERLPRRKIILIAQRPSDFVEMRRCAQALQAIGWLSIILYFGQDASESEFAPIEAALTELKHEGILAGYILLRAEVPVVRKPDKTIGDRFRRQGADRRRGRLHRVILSVDRGTVRRQFGRLLAVIIRGVQGIANGLRVIRRHFRLLKTFGRILAEVKPDAMVLPEDVVGLVTPIAIKAGHLQNVPSVILPYTIANQQEAFKSLKSNPSYRKAHWANWIAVLLFRKWVMIHDGISLVRLPAPYILGQELTFTSPPDPWMMNSGYANAIAIENEAMLDYYLAAGLPRSKMHVVGAIYDDHLAAYKLDRTAELQRLREELHITNDKPLLVVGGCPDQTGSCPPGFEFRSMDEFVSRLSARLHDMEARYQVIMRPHPNYSRMTDIAAEHGILCTTIDTARLVALSSVYIAFGSATIRWAISCGIPVINYDVFHYDYSDFKDIGGVIHIERFDQLEAVFSRLLSEPEFSCELERNISRFASRWGRLDGKSTQRIAQLINQLCDVRPVPRTSE